MRGHPPPAAGRPGTGHAGTQPPQGRRLRIAGVNGVRNGFAILGVQESAVTLEKGRQPLRQEGAVFAGVRQGQGVEARGRPRGQDVIAPTHRADEGLGARSLSK